MLNSSSDDIGDIGGGDNDAEDEDYADNENDNFYKDAWVHFHPVALLQLQAMHSP